MCNNGNDFAGELPESMIDKWYPIGENFWLRRTTDRNYLCVQIFPLMGQGKCLLRLRSKRRTNGCIK